MGKFDNKPSQSEIDKMFESILDKADVSPPAMPVSDDKSAASMENPKLFLVKPSDFESEITAVTGVWDSRKGENGEFSDSALIRNIGRMLLSAGGTKDTAEFASRLEGVLKREFECTLSLIRPLQWALVMRAVEWIADESAQYQDVVRLLTVLSEMPAPLHLRVTLKLRASFYLEHRIGDFERALDAALSAHALSPLSTQTAGLVFDKIRNNSTRLHPDKIGAYWKKIIGLYLDVLADRTLAKEKQVAVLLMLGWLFSDGMDDIERGCQCVARAKRLDPDNAVVAAKLAVMEAKCAEFAAPTVEKTSCRPPVPCPPIPGISKNKTYSA